MGLFFTLLYILTAYLTPPVLFGPLGMYHLEIILALLTTIFSVPSLLESDLLRMPQTWGAFGLMFAVFMSLVATGWIGGAPAALLGFLPSVFTFFFVVANFKKKSHLQMLAAVLLFVSVFVIVQSQIAVSHADISDLRTKHDYFMMMGNDKHEFFFRIQGLGVIEDPNDFAQFMVGLTPCLFLFWKKGSRLTNLLFVYVPAGVILTGIYLTHSRGALLALGAVLVVAFRKKIGLIPSAIGGVVMLGGLMAAGFTGGREVSASAGEDRMGAWSTGLQLIRMHPVFGVGVGHFTDFYVITAHNTIVVCAAETGLIGLFAWVLFMLASVRDCYAVSIWGIEKKAPKKDERAFDPMRYGARHAPAPQMQNLAFAGATKLPAGPTSSALLDLPAMTTGSSTRVRPGDHLPAAEIHQPQPVRPAQPSFIAEKLPGLPHEEVRRLANLIIFSFVGLFITGWFLSRAFSMVFFMYGGLAVVVLGIARESGMDVPRLQVLRAFKLAIAPTIALLAIVYVILRVNNLFQFSH